jgi:Bifunctional DNA primase/polymerase, N-terminal
MMAMRLEDVPVFPCKPDKSPLAKRGFYDARFKVDPGHWPLVGVPTGEASGFDVLDVDPKGLAWFDAQHLPLTRMHETRSGGVHLLFRHAEGLRCSAGRIACGVDVRAEAMSFGGLARACRLVKRRLRIGRGSCWRRPSTSHTGHHDSPHMG